MLIDLNQYNNPFPVSLLLLHIRLAQSPSMVEKRPYPKPSSVWPFSGLTHLPRCQKAGPKGFPMIIPKRYFTSTTHIDHHIVIFSLCKLFVILTVFFFHFTEKFKYRSRQSSCTQAKYRQNDDGVVGFL